jgi:hypothetical protein
MYFLFPTAYLGMFRWLTLHIYPEGRQTMEQLHSTLQPLAHLQSVRQMIIKIVYWK